MSSEFFGLTIDGLLWNGVEYMCSRSPLADFKDYENIFGGLANETYNLEAPVDLDKNYRAEWRIHDNMLYLCDIKMFDKEMESPEKYRIIEKLTKKKFVKEPAFLEEYPNGVIPAVWFSGFLYVKRQPNPEENYCDCDYRCEPFMKVEFKNGKLFDAREVSFMDVYVDGDHIYKHKENYIINPHFLSANRRQHCIIIPEEESLLIYNQSVYQTFFAHTNDKLIGNDEIFMCSESPLAVFKDYQNIFPTVDQCLIHMMLPIFSDKNYIAKWMIANRTLYLHDIEFPCVGNDHYLDEYPTRFQVIEDLTGEKLQPIHSFNKEGIPATWFSGTLYFRRYPVENETYVDCRYECEPFFKADFENGKVKSIERTLYMIREKK